MRTDGRGQRALLPFKGSVSETVFCDLYTQWLCPSPHDKLNTITNNGSFLYSHHLCHPARIEVNLDLFALASYVSTLCKNFTYSLSVYICQYLFSLLVQGKACSLPPNPGEGLGVPADSLPDHQAEPQDAALHMTYRKKKKGSWPDLSVICTSLFLFFCVSVISDMDSHHAVLYCCSCCVGFPLWSPLVEHCGSLV